MTPDHSFSSPPDEDDAVAAGRGGAGALPERDGPLSLGACPFSAIAAEPLPACSPLLKSVFSGVAGLLCAWLCFKRLNFGDTAAAWITGDWGFEWIGFSNSLASCN